MMQNPQPQGHRHVRFYVVMVTLVLAGIFLVLFLNEKEAITGSSVSLFKAAEPVTATEAAVKGEVEPETLLGKEVNVMVSFDQVPQVTKDATIKMLEVHFVNDNPKIQVNDDQLELHNLQDVTLKVTDFAGEVQFDSDGLSVEGEAKKLEVNGLTLAAKTDLALSFKNIPYTYLFVDEIELENVILPAGNGQIAVADKLSYNLEHEELGLFQYTGKIVIDDAAEALASLEGVARGVKVSGALLNLDVH